MAADNNIAELLIAVKADVAAARKDIAGIKTEVRDTIKEVDIFDKLFERFDKSIEKFNIVTEKSTTDLKKLAKGFIESNGAITQISSNMENFSKKGSKAFNTVATSAEGINKSMRDMAAQANRFNTGNILAQIQDIGVTAAMNMNPLTIALQQGTQLLYVFQQSKAPIREFVVALKSMFSPLSLLTISLTGLVAAGIQMVDWVSVAKGMLNGLGNIFITLGNGIESLKFGLLGLAGALIYVNRTAIVGMVLALEKLVVAFAVSTAAAVKSAASWIAGAGPIAWFTTAVLAAVAAITLFSDKTVTASNFLTKLGDKLKSLSDKLFKSGETAKESGKHLEKWTDIIAKGYEKIDDEKFKHSVEGLDTYTKTYKTTIHELAGELLRLQKESNGSFQINNKVLKQAKELAIATANQAVEEEKLREAAEAKRKADEESMEAWNSAIDYSSSLTKGFFSDMKSGLLEGQSAWEAFTNAVLKMLDKIADKMMDIAIDSMFDSLKQGQSSKKNNWMSSIVDWTSTAVMSAFGYENMGGVKGSVNPASAEFASTVGIKPTIKAAKGGAFTNGIYNSPTMFKFAGGGKFGVMGEAGPEAVMPLHRSPDGSLGIRADGMGGGSPVVVNVINNSNARATTQQRQTEQGTTIDVMIDELVAQKLGQQGTASNQALTAFNNRQLVAR